MKNKYERFDSAWSLEEWQAKCPNLSYQMLARPEMPEFLPASLLDKFNCGLLMASGNSANQTYVFQGYRIDGEEIDEHQYIVTFSLSDKKVYAGFLEHASYEGRTTAVPPEMQESIRMSGVNIDYQFPRKPPVATGSISTLDSAGLFSGFVNSVNVQRKKEGFEL